MTLRPAFEKFQAARAADLVARGMPVGEAQASALAEATGRQRYGNTIGDEAALGAELVEFEKADGTWAWGIVMPIPPPGKLFSTFDRD